MIYSLGLKVRVHPFDCVPYYLQRMNFSDAPMSETPAYHLVASMAGRSICHLLLQAGGGKCLQGLNADLDLLPSLYLNQLSLRSSQNYYIINITKVKPQTLFTYPCIILELNQEATPP